jgi:hypothetical protein
MNEDNYIGDSSQVFGPRARGAYRTGSDGSKRYDSGIIEEADGGMYGRKAALDPVSQTVLKQEAEKKLEEQLLVQQLKEALMQQVSGGGGGEKKPTIGGGGSKRMNNADAALSLLDETPEQINRQNVPASESGIVIEDADTGVDMVKEGLRYSRPTERNDRYAVSNNPERGGITRFNERPSTVVRGEENPEYRERAGDLFETLMGGGNDPAQPRISGELLNAKKKYLDDIKTQQIAMAQQQAKQRLSKKPQSGLSAILPFLGGGEPTTDQLNNDKDLQQALSLIEQGHMSSLQEQLGESGMSADEAPMLADEQALAWLVAKGKRPEEARRLLRLRRR